jgi:fumarate reductase flavoprotein subunit
MGSAHGTGPDIATTEQGTELTRKWDVIVVGGGSSGLPLALFAAQRGAEVLLLDHASELGGTLWVASGQMSAAGTRLQKRKGIEDSADEHYADVMRISRGSADPTLVRLAVDHAADTFDWLEDVGFNALPDHPVAGNAHEAYLKDRYYWGEKGGHSVRETLVPLLMEQVQAGRITLKLEHEVTELVQDHDGAITGVVARDRDGMLHAFNSRFTALTCGGYAANPELFEQLNGYPQYTAQPYPFARGAGIKLGLAAGGYLRGHENVYNNFGSLLNSDAFPCALAGRVITYPEMRQPWEVYVNTEGKRFIREDMPSVDAREMALSVQTARRFWIVFDQHILDNAPPILLNWTREQLQQAFNDGGPAFLSAPSLEGLAKAAGINEAALVTTVDGYNYGVHTGSDFLGRHHLPAPVQQGPFYALRMQGSATSSAVGLAVNESLQVIRADGSPIANLYAAGELLGAGQTMGKAACGGMMVTPALTFGRLLGDQLIPF